MRLSEEDIKKFQQKAKENWLDIDRQVYYHLGFKDWNVGEKLEANFQEKVWECPPDLLNRQKPFFDLLREKDSSYFTAEELKENYIDCYKNFRYYTRAVREYVFEGIRRRYFSFLPSRACLFVFKLGKGAELNKEAFNYWYDELNRPNALFQLQITGKIFHTNDECLSMAFDTKSLDTTFECAFNYWAGGSGNDPIHDEYIFVGNFEVLKIWPAEGVFRSFKR